MKKHVEMSRDADCTKETYQIICTIKNIVNLMLQLYQGEQILLLLNILIWQENNSIFFFFRFIKLSRITKAVKHQKYSTYQMKQGTLDS